MSNEEQTADELMAVEMAKRHPARAKLNAQKRKEVKARLKKLSKEVENA